MIVLSLILGIIAGGLVGGAMVLLDKIGFYLIVVVPVFGGAIIGFAIALPYLGRKARAVSSGLGTGLSSAVIVDDRPSRLPLIIVALLGTLVAMAVYWGGSYFVYQEDFVTLAQEQGAGFTREEALGFLDTILVEEYGSGGFVGFVQDLAAAGISINRATSSSDSGGINLAGGLAYAFWVIEALVMWGVASSTALGRARGTATPETAAAAA
jgi:hypothetical protein